jgi:Domain of unknown function (DUF4129)
MEEPVEVTTEYESGRETGKTAEEDYDYREFSEPRLNELRKQKSFQYDRMEEEKERRRREMQREYERDAERNRQEPRKRDTQNASSASRNTGDTNWLLILVLFAVAVGVIMVLLGLKPGFLFRRKGGQAETAAAAVEEGEDIHNMRFETELEKAIRLGNYRLAVRIQYLDTLKKLSDRGLIRWMPNKTNWEYVHELAGAPYSSGFRQITTAFEYAWYGEFTIDEPVFRLMQEKMLDFQQKL